jgi:3',5'-cyclic AMP phosphodiesterase CpdA
MKSIAIGLWLTAALGAQTFIQMSDPQFGMFSKDQNFEHETVNLEFAIANANRLKPAFVVITGDLINQAGSAAEAAEYKRITAKLDKRIPLYSMPGNHDVNNEPTRQSLAWYRERFGPDYYTFRSGEMEGIILNSNLEKGIKDVPDEAAKMEAWLRAELAKARNAGVKPVILFQHIPFFVKNPEEDDTYDNIPRETRQRYLALLREYGVEYVFSGHYHASVPEAQDGPLHQVITGPVGLPLKGGKSGFRVVSVFPGSVSHAYYDFGEIPEILNPEAAK